MITQDNFKDVLKSIRPKDKKRIFNSSKEYCVLYLNIFNVGHSVDVTLTNDYNRYQNVSNDGNCILDAEYILKELKTVLPIYKVLKRIENHLWKIAYVSDIYINAAGQYYFEVEPDNKNYHFVKSFFDRYGIDFAEVEDTLYVF